MKKLEDLRKEIDEIDRELVSAFQQRMDLQVEIAQLKKREDLPVESKSREEEILKKWEEKKYFSEIKTLYETIFTISKDFQKNKKRD